MGRFVFDPPAGGPRKEKKFSPPTQFSDINIVSLRGEDELFCDYKCRMWWANRILRRYRQGRPVEGRQMGTNRAFRRHQRKHAKHNLKTA